MSNRMNIGLDKNDKSNRYTMPRLQAKVEGRGNGIKTAIVNMSEIAGALKVDVAYVTKFFGFELGTISLYDKKTERAIVNGKHDASTLQGLLQKFIDTYVLCPRCHLPELTITVKKYVKYDCRACGQNGIMPEDKIVAYMIKNPPGGSGSKKAKKDKKEKKKKSDEEGDDDDDSPVEEQESNGAEVDAAADSSAPAAGAGSAAAASASPASSSSGAVAVAVAAAKQPSLSGSKSAKSAKAGKVGKSSAGASAATASAPPAEDEWFTDTSAEAAEARKRQELAEMGGAGDKGSSAIVKNNAELKSEPAAKVLQLFLHDHDRSISEITSELRRLQLSRSLNDSQVILTLWEGILDPSDLKKIPQQIAKYKSTLLHYSKDANGARLLFGCLEEVVGKTQPELLKVWPHILKALYDEDIVSDEFLINWFDSDSQNSLRVDGATGVKLRNKAKEVIAWLRSDEDQEDEDEDEDENEDEEEEDDDKDEA